MQDTRLWSLDVPLAALLLLLAGLGRQAWHEREKIDETPEYKVALEGCQPLLNVSSERRSTTRTS